MNIFTTGIAGLDPDRTTTVVKQRVAWNSGLNYYTDAQKEKQSRIGKRVMSSPKMREIKSKLMSELMTKRWQTGALNGQAGHKNRKPVMTPYGKFPSALTAAKELAPKLGLKPCTIQAYIIRTSEKYAGWYYVKEAK